MNINLIDSRELAEPASPGPDGGIVAERDRSAQSRSCPMCGSGATYQTQDGRWGCTQCGSTWA